MAHVEGVVTAPRAAPEKLAAVALMAAVESVGTSDSARLLEKTEGVLQVWADRGDLPTSEDRRVARSVVLARLWQATRAGGTPDRYEARAWWAERFRDVEPAGPRPAFGGVRLFRGARRERWDGLAWTDDLALAGWFAGQDLDGRVWTATVPSGRLLAAFPIRVPRSGLPRAMEFVADVSGMVLDEVAP